MNLLLDTCVWGGAKASLILLGHDVRWMGDQTEDPGDEEILAMAVREGRILVTLDKDFGELIFLHGLDHAGIIRLVKIPSSLQAATIASVLRSFEAELRLGAILTLNQNRIRVRLPLKLPPPQDKSR